jgi:acyl carrier protein
MRLQNTSDSKLIIFSGGADSKEQTNQRNEALSVEDIQTWFVAKLAEELGLKMDEIDVHEPFVSYGLDSMTMVTLSGDLEEWLGLRLAPTLAWDYPTIEALAQYLAREAEIARTTNVAAPDKKEVEHEDGRAENREQLQADVDQLSEAQLDALLNEMLAKDG